MSEEEMGEIALAYYRIKGSKPERDFFQKISPLDGEVTETVLQDMALTNIRIHIEKIIPIHKDVTEEIRKISKEIEINPIRAIIFIEILTRERVDKIFP